MATMAPEVIAEVERTRGYLLGSDLPDDVKDGLGRLLNKAVSASNGHPDKLQGLTDLMLEFVIHETRQSVRTPARIDAAVQAQMITHVQTCKVRNTVEKMPRWAFYLYTFKWQITVIVCVGLFTPQAPAIFHSILSTFK